VGRLLVGAGLVAALSGLWMTQFYRLPAHDGALLYGFRLLFGSLMAVSIVLGFAAIRRREIARHRAWMMRGYALGLSIGRGSSTSRSTRRRGASRIAARIGSEPRPPAARSAAPSRRPSRKWTHR
jgi:hypothetical protein